MWTKEGKQFTKWFMTRGASNFFDTENDAIEEMKIQKSSTDITDKVVKLKHEYEIRYIDIDELPKPSPPKKRGRPKKNAEG
jgi:hypothetical protein